MSILQICNSQMKQVLIVCLNTLCSIQSTSTHSYVTQNTKYSQKHQFQAKNFQKVHFLHKLCSTCTQNILSHMTYQNLDSIHQGLSNAPSPNIIRLKLTEIAQFKVYFESSTFSLRNPFTKSAYFTVNLREIRKSISHI